MRVAFLITGLTHAETHVVRIAAGLSRRGHRACVISIRPLAGSAGNTTELGVPVVTLNIRGKLPDPRAPGRLYTRLREFQRGVLVTFGAEATLLGRLVAPIAGVHCVISSVRPDNEHSLLRDVALRATASLSRMTVSSARGGPHDVSDRGIAAQGRVRVIADAVPTQTDTAPDPPMRKQLHIGADEFVWLSIGELTAAKDYATLLDACARLDDLVFDNWRLLVVGDGALRSDLESRKDRLGLGHRVFFLGFRTETDRLLRVADAFVMSSMNENSADETLIEAMLAERPCLATSVGSVPEILQNGVTGWVVPPRRPDRLCDRMHAIMQLSADQRHAIAAAARAFATPAFDVHQVIDEWEDLITEAVRSLPRSPMPSILTPGAVRADDATSTRHG